jgi:hypothetical protein
MARRIDRHKERLLPASFLAPGIEPLPAELLPLRDLVREAFGARRGPRQEWFEARGIARDWSAQVQHIRAGFALSVSLTPTRARSWRRP